LAEHAWGGANSHCVFLRTNVSMMHLLRRLAATGSYSDTSSAGVKNYAIGDQEVINYAFPGVSKGTCALPKHTHHKSDAVKPRLGCIAEVDGAVAPFRSVDAWPGSLGLMPSHKLISSPRRKPNIPHKLHPKRPSRANSNQSDRLASSKHKRLSANHVSTM